MYRTAQRVALDQRSTASGDSVTRSRRRVEVLLADSVSLALLVVLETLSPSERLAFVLHDMFAVPFDEIAVIVGRSPTAARQLASRARHRVQGVTTAPDTDLSHQRQIVDAFLKAARGGDFEALLAVLDPDIVVRADRDAVSSGVLKEVRGAQAVAKQALIFAKLAQSIQQAIVNGTAGIVAFDPQGQAFSVMGFTIRLGRIVEIDILADPERLRQLDLRF